MPEPEVLDMEQLAAEAMGLVEDDSTVPADTERVETEEESANTPEAQAEADAGGQTEEDSGRLNAVEQSLFARLGELGLTAAELAQVKTHFVPQSKFTRLRSKDREQVRTVVQKAQEVLERENTLLRELHAAKVGGTAPATQQPATQQSEADDAIEAFIASEGIDEGNPSLAAFLRTLSGAIEQKVERKYQKAREPEIQAQKQQQWIQAAESLRVQMVQNYGEEINKYFPDLIKEVHESGYTWTPQALFIDKYPQVAEKLRLAQASKQKPTNGAGRSASGAMEGFVGGASPRIKNPHLVTSKKPADDSPSAIAAAVWKEMGLS